ncbi:MAG: LuxR C-terminal-related transcriptional regulator, partial [Acidimicrobiales bacterium]
RESAAQAVGTALGAGDRAGLRAARRAEAELSLLAPGASTPMLALAPAPQLTAREREVSLLASGSATSQAIAAELGISVRTVDNLLSRSYLKLGVSSRDELGDALRREHVGERS